MRNPDVLHLAKAVAYKFIESTGYLVYFQYTNFSARKQSFCGHVGISTAMAGIGETSTQNYREVIEKLKQAPSLPVVSFLILFKIIMHIEMGFIIA